MKRLTLLIVGGVAVAVAIYTLAPPPPRDLCQEAREQHKIVQQLLDTLPQHMAKDPELIVDLIIKENIVVEMYKTECSDQPPLKPVTFPTRLTI